MKKKIFSISALAILACATESIAQSSSEIDKAQPGTTTAAPVDVRQTITDSRIPSSFQFLIGLCEVKDAVYYMPRTKFEGLTEVQRNYVLNNPSLFVIKD
jgi:hypothetical protein